MRKLLLSLIFLGMIFILSGCGDDTNGEAELINDGRMSVKADVMVNDYIKDKSSAEHKYKGQNIRVTGTLIEKGKFVNSDELFVVLADEYVNNINYVISGAYPHNKIDELNRLAVGDKHTFVGVCDGVVPQSDPNIVNIQITYDNSELNKNTTSNVNISGQSNIRTGIITGTEVRIRSGTGTNTDILGYFEKGEQVTILEVQEKWSKVQRSNGQIGWVSNDFCDKH